MLDGVIYLSWNMLLVYYKKHLSAGLFYGEGALLPSPESWASMLLERLTYNATCIVLIPLNLRYSVWFDGVCLAILCA